MSNFPYAIAFNLTFLQHADSAMLKKMGMDPKRCKEMVNDTYHMQQKTLGHNKAQYGHNWEADNGKRYTNLFSYDPSVNAIPLNETLTLAAHEIKHCERQDMMGRDKNAPFLGAVAGATLGFMLDPIAGMICTPAGFVLGLRKKNAATYNEEIYTYRHMEIMAHVLGTPTRYLQNNADTIDAKTRSFSGENYPNSDTINQIKYEAQEICAKNKIPVYSQNKIQDLQRLTHYNMNSGLLHLKHI